MDHHASSHSLSEADIYHATGTGTGTDTPYLDLDLDAVSFPSGLASPDPLLGSSGQDYFQLDRQALAQALGQANDGIEIKIQTRDITDHHDDTLPDPMLELTAIRSRAAGLPDEETGSSDFGGPVAGREQGVPPELPSLAAEVVFVMVCSAGQVIFALTYGHATVTQVRPLSFGTYLSIHT